ncbi:MAG: hypothetical protein ITG00_07780 [Flavobacterium sp.]|nr:hypothetical protein [Flavobacterium sp.]
MLLPASAQQHCGYDFTSYIVLHIHEDGKSENISGLKVTLVDRDGNPAVNTNNSLSWQRAGQTLTFTENYQIGSDGKKVAEPNENSKWYFPYAKDTYLLSVTNEFPADDYQVRIEDTSVEPVFKTLVVPLYSYNMYVLCTGQQATQFGRKLNKPVKIVLEREK